MACSRKFLGRQSRKYKSVTFSMCGAKTSRWCGGCARSTRPKKMYGSSRSLWRLQCGASHTEVPHVDIRRDLPLSGDGSSLQPESRPHFLAALTFAQRALCAAAILLRPAAEIFRFLRAATGPRLLPCRKTFPKVVSAAVTRWSSFSSLARSWWSCLTTD